MLSEFSTILIFILSALIFSIGTFLMGRLIRINRPNSIKLSTYESGEESIGALNSTFDAKYYIVGLAFLLFEVELLLLFPWSLVFSEKNIITLEGSSWYWYAFFELIIFLGLLAVGLLFIWKQGVLDWNKKSVKNKPLMPEIYEKFNSQQK